ncbi:MAG: hypothetical protein EPN97_17665 [Alphaproteobacteria bacterium]|nr:MAG: hypothetical protein EPN97_17665 [Alphaproteobacteria bacterium]
MSSFTKNALLTVAFAAAALTGCTPPPPPPPPPHNEFNVTMDCIGRAPERFEGVSLETMPLYYHVTRYEVVEGNKLRLTFEKNFRKLGCSMTREAVESKAQTPTAPSPKQ